NNTDMTIFYQSNLPNQDGIDANEITNIPVGNYTLQVLNSSGNCSATYNFVVVPAPCSNIQFTNVTINPSPIDGCYYNFGYDLNLGNCPGSVLTLNQNGSVLETYNLIGSVSTEITNLTTGNYNLHLSSAGCEMDYPFEVTPSLCNINIANAVVSSTGVLYCVNGRIDFDVTGTTCGTGAVALIQNGNILNTINWTTGNGAGLHFENLSPGNYSIVAVNNLFNVTCGDTLYFTVNSVQPPLSISNVSVNSTGVLACTSGNVSFAVNGQFCSNSFVIVFNESNTIVFSAPYNNGGNQIYNVSGLAPGNYTIEFGLVGYSITETFTVNPNPCNLAITNLQINTIAGSDNCTIANVTFTPTGDMCSNGYIQLMQNGSLIGASILWNQNTAPNISFDNLTPGIYTVFIATYFPNICSTSIDFEVLPTPCNLSIANISFTPSNGSNGTIDVTGVGAYCGNIAIALDAEISPANYSNLSTNYGNLITQFSNLSPGNYRVTISSSGSSCLDVEYITVTAATCNTNPIISASNTNICPGQTIILNSNYLTGNAWSNGGTSFNTQVTTSGTYTLTVTELNGCTGTTSITITNASNCVPATQMNNGVCGTINFVRTSSITCIAVAGATQYEWQFSNSNGVYATKTTTTNYVLLHGVSPTLNWGTNWNIKVRAKIGTNVGPYSPDCNIGIMPDPSINGVPQTQLRSQDCNKLNYRMNADNRIIANPVAGAIQYEFEFSSAVTGLVVATKLMTNNVLYLNTVAPSLTFPAQYNVRVRARIASTWAVFGTPCLIGIIGLNRDEDNNTEELEKINIQSTYDDYFDMTVMPNPFNEQAILRINSGSVEQINVEVFDMVGNIVWKNNVLSNNNLTFGVELAQGTYIVKAMNQKGNQAMFRFIKSK
ncbi:MAG TPA: T9SS type A sorting domain-containing protein, partial [Bacteroidia bacterium]|nr:T9SS type A sorting domain-containing protein [Bacteroidia bacterium]